MPDSEEADDAGTIDWGAVVDGSASSGDRPARSRARPRDADEKDDLSLPPLRRIALIAGGLIGLYLIANFVDVWLASGRAYDGTAPAAVVLGAAQYNGEPSAALRGRLDHAAELYTEGRVGLIVVTGGKQEADITTEAKTGYDYLRQTASVPDEDLLLEVDGSSTYQSLAATARFLQRDGVERVILVTDPYHAKRTKLVAEEVGLSAEVSPTDAAPSFGRLVRETLAVAVGRLTGFRRFDAYLDF